MLDGLHRTHTETTAIPYAIHIVQHRDAWVTCAYEVAVEGMRVEMIPDRLSGGDQRLADDLPPE